MIAYKLFVRDKTTSRLLSLHGVLEYAEGQWTEARPGWGPLACFRSEPEAHWWWEWTVHKPYEPDDVNGRYQYELWEVEAEPWAGPFLSDDEHGSKVIVFWSPHYKPFMYVPRGTIYARAVKPLRRLRELPCNVGGTDWWFNMGSVIRGFETI